ncbi:MAG TPA: hypothetical protein VLA98_05000 [Solirubrobacteraceae bacterium]|nr:hypothetical protein [Solirubrobacteraceae bacterium]
MTVVARDHLAEAVAHAHEPHSLVEQALPVHDVHSAQHVTVAAPAAVTWAALREADLSAAPVARALGVLATVPERVLGLIGRGSTADGAGLGLSGRPMTLAGLVEGGAWQLLGEAEGSEIVLGLVWSFPRMTSGEAVGRPFADVHEAGYVKVAWGFSVRPLGRERSILTTETASVATDAQTRGRFLWAWRLGGPLVALARRDMLDEVRRAAERRAVAGPAG